MADIVIGTPPPWTLTVYDPTGSDVLDTVSSNDSVARIDGGFSISMKPTGDCVSMTFSGRNDLLNIPPRAIVRFVADGHALFWGVIVRNPNLLSRGSGPADTGSASDLEDFVAEGGRSWLAARRVGPRYIEEGTDIGELFREYLTLYGPSALSGDLSQIADTGMVLTLYYKPESLLNVVFDELVSAIPGWEWGVDAQGRVFLKPFYILAETPDIVIGQPPQSYQLVSFDSSELLDFVYRPTDAENIATKVTLVIAGSPAGREAELAQFYDFAPPPSGRYQYTFTAYEYAARPITYSFEHPLHEVYQAEKVLALPEGVSPFMAPSVAAEYVFTHGGEPIGNPNDWFYANNVTNAANVYDDDPTTFAVIPQNTAGWIRWRFHLVDWDNEPLNDRLLYGIRAVYSGAFSQSGFGMPTDPHVMYEDLSGTLEAPNSVFSSDNDTGSVLRAYWALRSTPIGEDGADEDSFDSMYAVLPPSAQFDNVNREAPFITNASKQLAIMRISSAQNQQGDARIYYFYPLVLDAEYLNEVCIANLDLPSMTPGEAVLKGYHAPAAVIEITNLLGLGDGVVDEGETESATVADSIVDFVGLVDYTLTPSDGFLTRYTIGNDDVSEAGKLLRKYIADEIRDAKYALDMGARQ
jgi:hypothetical protein